MNLQTNAEVSQAGEGKLVQRFRLMLFQNPVGVWRPTRKDVEVDAIVAGLADYDAARGIVFLTVPAWIQESIGEPAPLPIREVRPQARRRSVQRPGWRGPR